MSVVKYEIHHEDDVDRGLEKVKEYLRPGEEFLTYTRSEPKEDEIPLQGLKSFTVKQQLAAFEASKNFESVRALPIAFKRNGEILPGYQAIVGIRVRL